MAGPAVFAATTSGHRKWRRTGDCRLNVYWFRRTKTAKVVVTATSNTTPTTTAERGDLDGPDRLGHFRGEGLMLMWRRRSWAKSAVDRDCGEIGSLRQITTAPCWPLCCGGRRDHPLYPLESRCYVTVMANGPWRGKWALVTGASSGIGTALAEELAAGGAHLVLTARRARRLATLRTRLRAAHGVRVEVLAADLAQPNTSAEIFAFTQERSIAVDLLVNNAGIGSYGELRAGDLEREVRRERKEGG